ncbi:PrsW family intramembrane metalloprotease [halophilic archaeon]|nr:PrsW family intramembrane metalloprotease [halophilic archaeon]
MDEQRDPVARSADGSTDLYEVSTWEQRSRFDRFSTRVYAAIVRTTHTVVVLLALLILVAQFALGGLAAITDPWIGAFVLLSVVPAFGIAAYIWYADVTSSEPLSLLVGTFLLGILFAGFAAVLNSLAQPLFQSVPLVGMVLFFYVVVAPVEETVKMLAVRLYPFRRPQFDAVVDGAVYGAVAGLGFATIENAIYISQEFLASSTTPQPFVAAGRTAVFRLFAGPGHVIYSAFAGYYLGLAKFNEENAGPIVVKGLLIAALIHATYNSLVGVVPAVVTGLFPSIPATAAFVGFVLVYDGIFGYLLYRKIARYRSAYEEFAAAPTADAAPAAGLDDSAVGLEADSGAESDDFVVGRDADSETESDDSALGLDADSGTGSDDADTDDDSRSRFDD